MSPISLESAGADKTGYGLKLHFTEEARLLTSRLAGITTRWDTLLALPLAWQEIVHPA